MQKDSVKQKGSEKYKKIMKMQKGPENTTRL